MITKFLKTRLNRFTAEFTTETEGSVSVESIIVLPAMLWLFGVGWTYFDAFHQQSVNQKANYVIGDMVSRETNTLTTGYIDNAFNLMTELTLSSSASADMRIAVVQYDLDSQAWSVVWSQQRGDGRGNYASALTDADMPDYQSRLPPGMDNEQLVLVETWEDWHPDFDVGLGDFEITTYSFTSPRYAPQIVLDAPTVDTTSDSNTQVAAADTTTTAAATTTATGGTSGTSTGTTSRSTRKSGGGFFNWLFGRT